MNIHAMTRDDVERLAEVRARPCLSLYLPLVTAGKEVRQNPIRLRNLLRRADELLADAGEDGEAVGQRAWALVDGERLWQAPRPGGLAVLVDADEARVLEADEPVDELAVVSDRFHLRPLLELLGTDLRFHVLDLNRQALRLFRGSRQQLVETTPDGLPRDYRDVVGRDRDEQHLQWHTGTGSPGGERDARFHGHGGGKDDVDDELRRFVAAAEPAIREALGASSAPLVLAGLEPMPRLYRDRNRYPHLVEPTIDRNVGDLDAEQLHRVAWPVAERLIEERRVAQLELVRSALAGELGSNDLREVVTAADDGRIETLLVARGASRWGRYQRDSHAVEVHAERRPDSRDLVDLAAVRTFATDGTVLAVDPGDMPGGRDAIVAASFRYPIRQTP